MSPSKPHDEASPTTPARLLLRSRVAPANDAGPAPRVGRVGPLGLPRTYWMLWSGMLLNRLESCVFFLLGLYLTRERGLRPEVAGLVMSLYAAGALLAGPVGGGLADGVGRRLTLLGGTAASGLFMLALGGARTTLSIVVPAPLLGFCTDLCRAPLQAAVADVVPPEERARAYGILYWAINLGFAGASALGGLLAVNHFGWLFVIDAMTTFAYGAIVLVGVSETRPALTSDPTRTKHGPWKIGGVLAPLRDRPFVSFALIQVLLLVAFAQVIVALPLDMRAHGLGVRQIGFLLGLNGVFIVIALALRYVRGRRHVHGLTAGALLTGLGLGATAFAGGPLVYALGAALWTLGEIGFSTASPSSPLSRSGGLSRGVPGRAPK